MPNTATAETAAAEMTILCLFDFFLSSLTFFIRSFRSTLCESLKDCFPATSISTLVWFPLILIPKPLEHFDVMI